MNVGDDVLITGPTGAEMLLPEDPNANIIMLATGTGIAPMRSYMRFLFNDKVAEAADGTRKFKGLAWLFMGVPYSNSLLMALGSSRVWHGCSWGSLTQTLCCMMTSMSNTNPSTQVNSGMTMQFRGSRKMQPAKKCTSRRRWQNTPKSCGTSCRTKKHMCTCVV